MSEWKQVRPTWCVSNNCRFLRRVEDAACTGMLPAPIDHGNAKAINTHRLCINPDGNDGAIKPGNHVFNIEIAPHDCDALRWILDAIDEKQTSWRSK